MHLPPLLAAVERGDDVAVFDLLDDISTDELAGDDAVTLLAAAARAGRHEVVDWLVLWDVDVTRPWADGVDPVTWAAEHGRYGVLRALLSRSRDPLSADSPHRRALRTAQLAIATEAEARSETKTERGEPGPLPAHRAIVTDLEAALGVHRSPDELMARALVHADPGHDDWFASLFQLGYRADQETFDWARRVAEEGSCLDRRRFALDTVNFLGFDLDVDQDDEPPFAREAAEFLRPLLDIEQDPHALATVIAAFCSYRPAGTPAAPAILAHADHADPKVRHSVAVHLYLDTPGGTAVDAPERRDVVAALVRLAVDPVPEIRATALYKFTASSVDTPELRAVLAANLTDPHLDTRIEAAAGLALRGDERGLAVLDEIRSGIKHLNSPSAGRLEDIGYLLRTRAATADRAL
ncbi:ankyrin repeat domain-containing protein [Kitasatospora sp. NPDC004799]|uniref:ankyrin repeat domain-containing protein n=1 Tax=Kitasatospora sp. NPDC004799 TaxID=3154460 RepID=UPI0033A99EA0